MTVGCQGPPELVAGQALVTTYKSSDHGERSFCSKCGSNLFHGAPAFGYYGVSAGVLESSYQDKLTMDKELFIDKRPSYYSLEGDQPKMTEAEFLAMVTGGDGGDAAADN